MKYLLSVLLLSVNSWAYAQRDIASTNELTITGDVKAPRTFAISDIKRFKQTELGDLSIKNHKGEEKYVAHHVKGVLIKSLLDSVDIKADKPKELSEYVLVFIASDNYKNVYSWNEIFNTEVGNRLYILTEKDGKDLSVMDERLQVLSLADVNMGMRRMRGLATIEVKKVK